MAGTAKQLYKETIARDTINDKIKKNDLRIVIAEKKLEMLNPNPVEYVQILDILDPNTDNCLANRGICYNDDASKLTYYHQFAKILDEILDNIMLDILDSEKVSKAAKTSVMNIKKVYNAKISLSNGFGRRINLILATKNIELSPFTYR
ncbi:uncharacterized protein EV154DRAFT_562496 [Mucor mucedo]|uniref:uncharacterized protein n=1 Tax=Mucor mucedo TaxID=29922 RepID=UPI00221ECD31|nr:uncharacterized protein EV154DRAFT_562496 [Mucor mucedo]KAI7892292.1 hypothetical protein EV154DRAFT_562496 [Mucor mucedo]